MQIISHRGYWKKVDEKNTAIAFERSFALGFGTETDFRDRAGELVIAHDLPTAQSGTAEDFFRLLARHDPSLPLAINIKADGLQSLLKQALRRHGVENYFLFDMSVPDALYSLKVGLRVFTRHSDVERHPAFYEQAAGVWIDALFRDDWMAPTTVSDHLQAGKHVCLVSPELHKRPHLAFWNKLRATPAFSDPHLTLCTDLPEDAKRFFKP